MLTIHVCDYCKRTRVVAPNGEKSHWFSSKAKGYGPDAVIVHIDCPECEEEVKNVPCKPYPRFAERSPTLAPHPKDDGWPGQGGFCR